MLKEKQSAPKFSCFNQDKETITIDNFKDKNLVIFFYPKDLTPGCTIEAIEFTKAKEKFLEQNTEIIGVSKDSIESHKRFCEKKQLAINLLSDPDAKMLADYGVWQEKSMFGKKYMGIVRSTFLIDKKGTIQKIWSPVKIKNHVKEVLEESKKLSL